ncbi:MAG TPA: hypothetical protein VHE61_00780 [Opitutaceae bacterium]|nr:hypothetical protein [Opitutaceae bacterium]
MGASTWNYFVPYDGAPERALRQLREDVFRNEKYGDGIPSAGSMRTTLEELIAERPDAAEARDRLEAMIKKIEALRAQMPEMPKPSTIEELLEQRAENGTHSILDIQGISPTPDFGAVSPLPREDLVALFGSDQPTHEAVEAMLGDERLMEHPLIAERWQGVYFTVYRDDQPAELCFIGTSGD